MTVNIRESLQAILDGEGQVTAEVGSGTAAMYEGAIWYVRTVGDTNGWFRVSNLRQERTGLHGRLEIGVKDITLAWTHGNLERDEDRVRISGSAYKVMPELLKTVWPKEIVKLDLDGFCHQAWALWTEGNSPDVLSGEMGQPQDFMLRPYVLADAGTILYAPPGRGKSYTGMLMAVSIDAGCDYVWPVDQAPALMVNLERSARSIRRRLGLVNFALGLDPERPLRVYNARGRTLDDLHDGVMRAIETHGIRFILLDSVSRAGSGSLTDDKPARQIMDMLNAWEVSWLALAHTPRTDETHVFGSIQFDAAADVVVALKSQEETDRLGIGLEITKSNDTAKPPMEVMRYEFDQEGLRNVAHARRHEFAEIEASVEPGDRQKVIMFLRDEGASSVNDIMEATGLTRKKVDAHLKDTNTFVRMHKTPAAGDRRGPKEYLYGLVDTRAAYTG